MIAQRLAQMGVLPGSRLRIIHTSPFKGTLEVSSGQGQSFAMGEREIESLDCELIAMPLPLAIGKTKTLWRIRQLNGGKRFRQRMEEWGILPGTKVQVAPATRKKIVVTPVDKRLDIELGTGEASKIIVEAIDEKP